MIAIYCRASDEKVLDMQERTMRTGTELAGVSAAQTLLFTDIGGTGSSIDRPGMNKLRAALHEEDIECVFVLGSDRIATQYDQLALFLQEAKDAGVKVYAICTGQPEDLEWMLSIGK
ncbi:MAG: recombinase family protein [Clostridia bacterium]|nr:recombinase family protein [Clostridia bacterium]